MGKSLPRICKACKTTIKTNFNKHINKVCKKNHAFQGWIFLNKDGKQVKEDFLPYRADRVLDGKPGLKIGRLQEKAQDVYAKAWRTIRRGSLKASYSVRTRERAFTYFVRKVMDDQLTADKLIDIVKRIADERKK